MCIVLQFFGWQIFLLLFNLDPCHAMKLLTMSKAPYLKPPYLAFLTIVPKVPILCLRLRQASYFFPGPWECWKIIVYKCSIVQADFIENYFEITSWFEVRVFLEGNKACHKRPFASWKKLSFEISSSCALCACLLTYMPFVLRALQVTSKANMPTLS